MPTQDSLEAFYYERLQCLLEAKQWEKADQATLQVMLRISRDLSRTQREVHFLWDESLNKFPSDDLQVINRLWVTHSEGFYGFSVQRQIWEAEHDFTYSEEAWNQFCNRVGWRKNGVRLLYNELFYDKPGSLPARYASKSPTQIDWPKSLGGRQIFGLLSRLTNSNV